MIVVDTNILVSFVLREEVGARVRRQDPEWAAPVIAVSEIRNVLMGFVRRGKANLEQAKRMNAAAVRALGGRIHVVDGDAVLDAAFACGLTAYDAEFVVCARALVAPLVTLDAAMLRGAPDVAVAPAAFA